MKKVLLINPEDSRGKLSFDGIITNEPLDLEVIYTELLNNNIDCKFYDFIAKEENSLEDMIKEYKPNYIVSNGVTHQINFVLEYFELAKQINKNIKTIITGSFAEYNYKYFFDKKVDYVCRSFDPKTISAVILEKDFNKINGLCYKNKNEWVINNLKYHDINKLPITNREQFYKNKDKYRYLELEGTCQIRTSYSCPYKCKFCYRTILNCSKYVAKDIIKIVDEVETVKSDIIYFVDDDFLFNKNRLKEFIKEIKKRKINKKYIAYGRVDFIINNKDIIKELKEIGFYYLLVGLESVSNENLNDYNKLITKNSNEECVKFLNEVGINCMGMFIVDTNFKSKDFKNMYKWIKNNKLKHVALSIYTPLPGSKLYELSKEEIITDNLSKYDYIHVVSKPKYMSVKRFYLCYYILVVKLFRLANKYKVYDFINYKELSKELLKQVIK